MYDELRTQYSVLEAYSAKLDDKVAELEELLESMDQIHNTKPEIESNESEEMQKLRSENEGLKDIIIRFTREDVSNIREDSISIRQRDFPVKSSTIFPSKPPALVSPQTSDTDIPVVPEQDSDLKGKLSSTTLQLRKQISSKKIPKLRPSFRDSECHPQPAKREVSQSLKPRPPTDRRNMNIDLSLDKKVGFDSILNAGSSGLNDKLPEPPLTDRPSSTGSQNHPLRTNSIRYYVTDQSKLPITTNGKPVINTALLSSHSDSAIVGSGTSTGSDNFVNEIARRLSGKWSLPEVPKLPHELLKFSQGKGELVLEKDKAEIRKQVEDMRINLDKIVHVVAHLTDKYC